VSESASYLILCLVTSGQQAGIVLGVRFPVVSFVALCGLPQSLQKLVVLRGVMWGRTYSRRRRARDVRRASERAARTE